MPQHYSPEWAPYMMGAGTPPFVAGENPPDPWQQLFRRLFAAQAVPQAAPIGQQPTFEEPETGTPIFSATASGVSEAESPFMQPRRQIPMQSSPIGTSATPQPIDEIGYAHQFGEALVPDPTQIFTSETRQRHPGLSRFFEGLLHGTASLSQDPMSVIKGQIARAQAREALPAQRLQTGMALAEWLDKQRRGLQAEDITLAGERRKSEMHPLEMESERALAQQREATARSEAAGGSRLRPETAYQTDPETGEVFKITYDPFSGEEYSRVRATPTEYQQAQVQLGQQRLAISQQAQAIQAQVVALRAAALKQAQGLTPTQLSSLANSLDRITNMRFLAGPEMEPVLQQLESMIRDTLTKEEQRQRPIAAPPPTPTPAPTPAEPAPTGEGPLGFTR